MKTLGLIGGMSWESSAAYYQRLNEIARDRLGGLHSARLLLLSIDFEELAAYQQSGDWKAVARLLIDAARRLEGAGAELLLICANTPHLVAGEVQAAVAIPLLHIVDAAAAAIKDAGGRRPLLLGTRPTMEHDFYKKRMLDRWGIAAVIPGEDARAFLHHIIYDELCRGILRPQSRTALLSMINQRYGEIDGVILGCTELAMLIETNDIAVPVFDSARLHAEAAMDFALSGGQRKP